MANSSTFGSASSLAATWWILLITLTALAPSNIKTGVDGGLTPAPSGTKMLTRFRSSRYLKSSSAGSSSAKMIKKAVKSAKGYQNIKPLEYELELDFSETGKLQNNINGLVEIYAQVESNKCDKSESGLARAFNAMSCKVGLIDQTDRLRLITMQAGEGVTVRESKVELGASIEALKANRGELVSIESQLLNEQSRMFYLSLARPLEPGSFARVTLRFESNRLYDFVRYSRKRSAPNEPPTSSLEAYVNFRFDQHTAERTFPCLNSPKFKSKIKLAIVADRKLRAISNMPPVDMHDDPRGRRNMRGELLVRTEFAPTPPIPIHKLIYSLGPYEERSSVLTSGCASSGPQVHLVAPANLASQESGQFALELAQAALDWMTRKLRKKLPIERLHLVATHARDFNTTSSLGCALIDANQLLLDPSESSPERKLLVAWNVAHVVAQQWFGGLVTERRGRDYWIPDGLAGQLAFEMLRELKAEMGVHHYVRSHLLTRAMHIRTIRLGHDADDQNEDQRQELVEERHQLSYIKSTAIVGMLRNLVGQDKFQTALETLVARGASNRAPGSDAVQVDKEGFVALLATRDQPAEELGAFIDAWRSHPSFPVISVQPKQSDPNKAIQLYQIAIHRMNQVEIGLWPNRNGVQIPLRLLFNDEQGTRRETVEVLDAFKENPAGEAPKWNGQLVRSPEWFQLEDYESGHWLKLLADPDTFPFFVVHYSASGNIAHRFKTAIENFAMGPEDRLSLLRDATTLLQAKPQMQTSVDHEELISWFQNERMVQVVDAALSLNRATQRNQDIKTPPVWAVRLFERHGFRADRARESEFEEFVRSNALVDLVQGGHKQAIETALEMFERDLHRVQSALLKPAIYAALARAGSQKQQEALLERLDESSWPEEIDRLRWALEDSNDAEIREKLRQWCETHNCEVK